ncbi:MAG: PQQ-binding-like beta-propeller repeat protein [Candidatus Aminicenantes bacterium]|nr:MAG: PQQ-binding-like beta-propeller repeat protein [Candidatus Aminicenantes bacterium]
MTERKTGILLMADIINYSVQSKKVGDKKSAEFLKNLENRAREMSGKYNANFIKIDGDAILVFIKEIERFLELVKEFRQNSIEGDIDSNGIRAQLRMVAHYGRFSFELSGEKPDEILGAEAIKVFRIEKCAGKHEVVITKILCDLIREDSKDHDINPEYLDSKRIKGFDEPIVLYKLIFPQEVEIQGKDILNKAMEELELKTKDIPIFGNLYPSLSMKDHFVNLSISLEADPGESSGKKRTHFKWDTGEMENISLRDSRSIGEEYKDTLNVSKVYLEYKKGIILGLPGSGKTTILTYFAYREFERNRELFDENEEKRVILFIECRNLSSFREWYKEIQSPGYGRGMPTADGVDPEILLEYFTFYFLHKGKQREDLYPGKMEDIKKAGKVVIEAYKNGQLTLLADALDEAKSSEIKDDIVNIIGKLFEDSRKDQKAGNRIFLTARGIERREYLNGESTGIFRPLFEVRSLDPEQLREMARYFYQDASDLYRKFDEVVWKEEIATKTAGTPLTALLVIVYFQNFGQFDTRYAMYHLFITFILIRAWDKIKTGHFKKDMNLFLRLVRDRAIFAGEEYEEVGKIYDALTFLSYIYIIEQQKDNRMSYESIRDILGLFVEDKDTWIKRLEEDYLLVPTGIMQYVFIHFTVMEYLAARFLVEKLSHPGYLKWTECDINFERSGARFFQSEVLPIAMGSEIKTGIKILQLLKQQIDQNNDEADRLLYYKSAVNSLAELENTIVKKMEAKEIAFLKQKIEQEVKEHFDTLDWIYKYLRELLLHGDKPALQAAIKSYHDISKLSRPIFLERYLTYREFSEGGSEIVFTRAQLLYVLMNNRLVDNWLKRDEERKIHGLLEKEKKQIIAAGGNLLRFDSEKYNPEDKNFRYYQEKIGNSLQGFLGSPNLKHSKSVNSVITTGKLIVSGSYDGTVKVWDMESGKELRSFNDNIYGVRRIAVAGKTIISGASDQEGTIKSWDMESGRETHIFAGLIEGVRSIAIEAQTAAFGTIQGTIQLWNVETGKKIRNLKGHDKQVNRVVIAGNTIVSGAADGTVKSWDLGSGRELHVFKGHTNAIKSLAVSGKTIAAGASDGSIKLWDRQSGREIKSLPRYIDSINSLALLGHTIVFGAEDGCIKLWDIETGKEIHTLIGHSLRINAIAVQGKTIISASGDGSIKLWDMQSGKELKIFKRHEERVNSTAVSGKTLVSGADDDTVKRWDMESGKEIRTLKGHQSNVNSVLITGRTIISAAVEGTIKLWDMDTHKEIRTLKGHTSWVNCLALKDKTLISGSSDDTIRLWNIETGQELYKLEGNEDSVNSIELFEKFIAAGLGNGTLVVWDMETRQIAWTFIGHHKAITCISIKGNSIISGSVDHTIKRWDWSTQKEVRTFTGHAMAINSIDVVGEYIVSAADDKTIKLWNMDTGDCVKTIHLPWIPLHIKQHAQDPDIFITANANGTITLFDLSCAIKSKRVQK